MKYKQLFLLSFLNPLGLILTIEYANAQNINNINNDSSISIKTDTTNHETSSTIPIISAPLLSNNNSKSESNINLNNNSNENASQLPITKLRQSNDEFSLVPPFYTLSHDKNGVVAKTLNKKADAIYTEQ